MAPLISVLLPTFEMGTTVGKAIVSILAQTFADFELLIINDGSTDDTPDILADYAARDSRIVVVHNPENIGLIRTLNKGLQLARGSLIARQDADNLSLRNRFAKQVDYLQQHAHIGLVGARVLTSSSHGAVDNGYPYPQIVLPPALIPWELLFYTYFAHDAIMARRDLLLQVGGYRLDRLHAEDYDLWFRLSKITQMAMLPDTLAYFFHNPDGVSQRYAERQKLTSLEIIRDAISDLLEQPASLADARILYQISRLEVGEADLGDLVQRGERLLSQLHTAYVNKFSLTEAERALLDANMTSKLSRAQVLFLSTQLYLQENHHAQ